MPNPRAQRPLSLQAVTEDLKSLSQPAQALLDMTAGAAKGSVSATMGVLGDLRELVNLFGEEEVNRILGKRLFPTTEEMSAKLPAVLPPNASKVRQQSAGYGQTMGEFIPTPGSGRVVQGTVNAVKSVPAALKHGAEEFVKASAASAPRVIKPTGGQFYKGALGSVDRAVEGLSPYYFPDSNEKSLALNKWVENNIQNYMKRDMASPSDPIRALYEARGAEKEKLTQKFTKKLQSLYDKIDAAEQAPQTDDTRRAVLHLRNAITDETAKFESEMEYLGMTHRKGGKPFAGLNSEEYKALVQSRLDEGFPGMGVAMGDLAQAWETKADQAIKKTTAGKVKETKDKVSQLQKLEDEIIENNAQINKDFEKKYIEPETNENKKRALARLPVTERAAMLENYEHFALDSKYSKLLSSIEQSDWHVARKNPWTEKLDPNERLYGVNPQELDFQNVIDVLSEDLKAGRLKPEQLNKVSLDQAVQRTIDYEIQEAKKIAEEKLNLQKNFPVHKEYPGGYKWIELAPNLKEANFTADNLPSGYFLQKGDDGYYRIATNIAGEDDFAFSATPEGTIKKFNEWFSRRGKDSNLEAALADEGKRMGHCVGGYCPDVMSGETRIFSLRDNRGNPHITVEVQPYTPARAFYSLPVREQEGIRLLAQQMADREKIGYYEALDKYIEANVPAGGEVVNQIKGKGNREAIEKYWPYGQDFVRSGNYADVIDAQNVGLNWKLSNLFDPEQVKKLKEAGHETPSLLTDQERNNLIERMYEIETKTNPNLFDDIDQLNPPEQGMKRGGRVSLSDNRDTHLIELMDRDFKAGIRKRRDDAVRHYGVGGLISGLAAKSAPKKTVKASEALAPHINKKVLGVTEVDRSLTDPDAGMYGGVHFPRLQHESLPHADVKATWGTMTDSAAGRILGAQKKHPKDSVLWTTRIGGPESHRGNEIVFGRMIEDFARNLSTGKVSKEQVMKINNYLSNAVTEKGGPKVFANGFDITDPTSLSAANTFDRRQLVANVLAGNGVGGMKGRTVDYDKIIKDTTEPSLLGVKTGMVGPRLFQLTGDIVHDPSLNPAFHKIMTGKDMDVEFELAPAELMLQQYYKGFQENKGRLPGEYDFRRGHYPTEPITEPLVNRLAIEGFKRGGRLKKVGSCGCKKEKACGCS